jgi:putative peptidoglycan lipid II flippase
LKIGTFMQRNIEEEIQDSRVAVEQGLAETAAGAKAKQAAGSSIARGAGVVAFFTSLSRISGLVRDMVVLHIFGASAVTDAFYVAFTIPNTLRRLVAEGALTIAFIPIYTDVMQTQGEKEARRFFAATLGLLICVLLGLTFLGIVFAKWVVYMFASGFAGNASQMQVATELTQWMFPYIIFVSLVALFMGVLNAHQHFAAPAASPILLNLGQIAGAAVLAAYFDPPIFGLALGVVLGGAAQLALQYPAMKRMGLLVWPTLNWRLKAVHRLGVMLFPALFGIAVYQINLIILRQMASYLPAGQITYYYNADRLMQFALGIFAISIATAALPTMSRILASGDKTQLIDTWRFSFRLTNFITIPAGFGLFAVATPVVAVLYMHGEYKWVDAEQTAWATMAFAPGLIAMAVVRTTVQAFYALKDTRTPVVVAAFTVVVNFACGLAFLKYEVTGLALAITVSSFFQAVLLMFALRLKVGHLGGRNIIRSTSAQSVAAALSCGVAYLLTINSDWTKGPTATNALVLFGSIGVAIALYMGIAWVFRFDDLLPIKVWLKKRFKK